MSIEEVFVVVGASHAGCQLAESVRKTGWQGKIVVVGEESHLPYHRPPLSKDFLSGKKEVDNILIRPQALYEKLSIEYLLGKRVTSIDRDKKCVLLCDGQILNYDKLGLTTGARARKVNIPGSDKEGVYYLRNVDDIERIRPHVAVDKKVVIVGGGYIGLETAASLRQLGMDVTVIEMMPRILQRVTAPELSEFYMRAHREEGVTIVTNSAVKRIEGESLPTAVVCQDGRSFPADLVIIGAGIEPNVELAMEAGLEVKNGIVVDEFAQTSDSDIVAAGDCTFHYNPTYDRWLRLESVQNATDQAKTAAASVCGEQKSYNELPWFWSDQYDMKLQIAGLSEGYDDLVIRGDSENSRKFAAFYFKGEDLLAIDAVNMPPAFMIGKKLLLEGKRVDKNLISDESFDLKNLLK